MSDPANYINPTLPRSTDIGLIRDEWFSFFHEMVEKYITNTVSGTLELILSPAATLKPRNLDQMINKHDFETIVEEVPVAECRNRFATFLATIAAKFIKTTRAWDADFHSMSNTLLYMQQLDLAKDSFAHTLLSIEAAEYAVAGFHFRTFVSHFNAAKDAFVKAHLASLK